jgi:hypothetical protein
MLSLSIISRMDYAKYAPNAAERQIITNAIWLINQNAFKSPYSLSHTNN